MTTPQLTETGLQLPTAAEIRAWWVSRISSIEGFNDAPTDANSPSGQFVSIAAEREGYWVDLMRAVYMSGFVDFSTGLSLDATVSNTGNAREEEAKSTVTLKLYNETSTTAVTVPISTQVRQSATSVIWETTEEVEIGAYDADLVDLDINTITWDTVSGTTLVDIAFNGTPDLSNVQAGYEITFSGCGNSSNDGTFFIVSVTAGSYTIRISNSARTDATDDEASDSAGTATIIPAIEASAQSLLAGNYTASVDSINEVVTAISGLDRVRNKEAASAGNEEETDTDLRRRSKADTVISDGGTAESVRQKLLAISHVSYADATENDTANTVGGLKPHSYHFTVVFSGDAQDIVDAIGLYKGGGNGTNGSQSGTYTDATGNTHTIYYDIATEINPYVIVNLTTDSNYPSDGDASIKAALVALDYSAGEDVLNHQLQGAINELGLAGITDNIQVLQGTTASPATSNKITIAATEVAVFITDRITVNS